VHGLTSYGTIVVDPPWRLREGGAGPSKGAAAQYELMSLGAITTLDVERLMSPDCCVFLWVPSMNLVQGDAYMALAAWRLTPKALHTWVKPGFGVGWYGRSNTEHFVVATRGKPVVSFKSVPTAHHWSRGAHSAKPDAFYDLAQAVGPGPYVDLFARRRRIGWDVWGEEVDSDLEMAS
jgi:N6-adenosine-specific RNA methylase IME4